MDAILILTATATCSLIGSYVAVHEDRRLGGSLIAVGVLWALQYASWWDHNVYPLIGFLSNAFFCVAAAFTVLSICTNISMDKTARLLLKLSLLIPASSALLITFSRREWIGYPESVVWPDVAPSRELLGWMVAFCAVSDVALIAILCFCILSRWRQLAWIERTFVLPLSLCILLALFMLLVIELSQVSTPDRLRHYFAAPPSTLSVVPLAIAFCVVMSIIRSLRARMIAVGELLGALNLGTRDADVELARAFKDQQVRSRQYLTHSRDSVIAAMASCNLASRNAILRDIESGSYQPENLAVMFERYKAVEQVQIRLERVISTGRAMQLNFVSQIESELENAIEDLRNPSLRDRDH